MLTSQHTLVVLQIKVKLNLGKERDEEGPKQ